MLINTIKKSIPPIHPEGHQFIIIFALLTILMSMISNSLGVIGVVLTLWCAFFFRDPIRVISAGDDNLVSPADGVVQTITTVEPPEESGLEVKEMKRISIFLSVFNVHVNRLPCEGTITKLHYRPGKFINASLDKASVDNERQVVCLKNTKEDDILVVQIAGLIARRIVCNLSDQQKVEKGAKFGIIRFGSRVDLYVPIDYEINVLEGQTVIGGETILATVK